MFASSPGGDIQDGDNPCPGSATTAFHANNEADTRGCALAITYKSDASSVKPEDFTVFTTNQTCVWHRFTDFQSLPTFLLVLTKDVYAHLTGFTPLTLVPSKFL